MLADMLLANGQWSVKQGYTHSLANLAEVGLVHHTWFTSIPSHVVLAGAA